MKKRVTEKAVAQRLSRPEEARRTAFGAPGRRFNRRFARHLLSALLIINMMLNSIPLTAVSEDIAMGITDASVTEVNDFVLGDGFTGIGQGDDLSLSAYSFELEGEKQVLLSTIVEALELPINLKKVEIVAVLGQEMVVMPEETVEMPLEWLAIEPVQIEVDGKEKSDYLITVLADFLEAGFSVYTDKDMYIIRLTNLVTPEVEAVVGEQEESQLEAVGIQEEALTEPEAVSEITDQGLYTCDLAGGSEILLSTLLVTAQLPVELGAIEAVAALGTGDGTAELVSVMELEGDYLISALRDFDRAGIALYTADNAYNVVLLNGRLAQQVEEPAEQSLPEQAELQPTDEATPEQTETDLSQEPVPEEIDVDLPEESAEAPSEEPIPEEIAVDLGEEPQGAPTEEPVPEETSVELTEEPVEEATEEPIEEPSEESIPEEVSVDLGEEPEEAPSEEPIPEEVSVDLGEEPEEAPSEEPIPEEIPVEPVEEPVEEPAEEPVPEENPVELSEEPIDEPAEEPVPEEVPVELAEEPIDEPAEEPAPEESAVDLPEEPVEALTEEPVPEEVPVELTEESVEEPAEEAVPDEVPVELTEGPIEAPVEEPGPEEISEELIEDATVVTAEAKNESESGETTTPEGNPESEGEGPEEEQTDVGNETPGSSGEGEPLNNGEGGSEPAQGGNGETGDTGDTGDTGEVGNTGNSAPAAIEDLAYTGEPQALVTAGAVEGGTMLYSLSEEGEFTEDIPTATDAGEYTVYYKTAVEGQASSEINSLTATIAFAKATVVANDASKIYGEADPQFSATVNGLFGTDAVAYGFTRQEGDTAGKYTLTPTGEATQGNYSVEYEPGTFTINAKEVTVTAEAKSKIYGEADPQFSATVDGLLGTDAVDYGFTRQEGETAGEYAITPTGEAVQGNYTVNYVDGILTINPKALTITARSGSKPFDQSPLTVDTCTPDGLISGDRIDSVTNTGSQTYLGSSENVPSSAVIRNAEDEDVTGSYDITYVNGTLTVTWPDGMIAKTMTSFNGDLANYRVTVNPESYILSDDGRPLILKDTFSENQSIDYGSVSAVSSAGESVFYDFSGNTGTYTIPDGSMVTIEYTTRVKGQVGKEATFDNTAVLGRMEEGEFASGPSATVTQTQTITPTGSDIAGTGGVYSIELFAYAEGHMEQGLEGAVFRMLDSNMRPMYYLAGEHKGEPVTFTTNANGFVTITLSEEADGLTIHKNTVYFLEMTASPYQIVDGEYVYYQKDNTFYSFLITDDPSYQYGSIYSYFNGDVLKVRCYPEAKGINITKRFSGNYTLTDEQKNAIRFVLQKEALGTQSGWVDVESHTYGEFSYGSINFNTGREGGAELEDFATYRVIEENALPEELAGAIDENVTVSVSYQQAGVPKTDGSNEFFVDPDDKLAFSYDFAFTNEYVDHKLTLIKINENTGVALPGATFAVYAASDPQTPVGTYVSDDSGSITIRKGDDEAEYLFDTLYYVVESKAPEGYYLPDDPQKIYFFFSEDGSGAPNGVPSGVSATDLTTSYNTVTLSNSSENANVPVTVTWGINGNEPWPDAVTGVVIGLYKSVGGAAVEPVLDEDDLPLTVELTGEQYYNTTAFANLPAQEDEKEVVYSIRTEGVYSGEEDVTNQFAHSSSISGTGWYVINLQEAISVVIRKQWRDLEGQPVSDATDRPDVTFTLYRTTQASDSSSFTREELAGILADAEKVRSGLKLSASAEDSWSATVESLQKTDKKGNTFYYYALEDVPDNQEDSYVVAAATETDPRTLTIVNRQTPFTVTIKINDAVKTYGDADPDYVFDSSVKEDGASIAVSGPDEDGNYTAAVTSANGNVSEITFTVSRGPGEDAGTYTVAPSGEALQKGYRVLFESGTLTIQRAQVTITAGAEKVYGQADPELVTISGLKNGETADVLSFAVSREEGEDVDEYPITLTGETVQGNYEITYIRADADNKPYPFRIRPAQATVTAIAAEKLYGEDDPVFTASVEGLQFTDEPSTISYDLTRSTLDENIGTYTITPLGEATQGNYTVSYYSAEFTIKAAPLTVKVVDVEKTYGDDDPEWEVELEGLQRDEDTGALSSVLDAESGVRTYTLTFGEGDEAVALLSFVVSRQKGEGVGEYTVTPSGAAAQGNYALTFQAGTLNIQRAELTVTPDHIVKAIGLSEDPLLTATVTGWKSGDVDAVKTYEINAGVITWTYTLDNATVLTFTLERDPGEEEGDYQITARGLENQSNYIVEYEPGSFGILAVLDIDVTQPLVDHADANANPEYSYTATLDLAGTGLTEYEKNGFELVDGVPTLTFTLPAEDKSNMKTLKVPGGAKLNVRQNTTNDDYTTVIRLDGVPYANTEDPMLCKFDRVDTYHEIAFTHSRISLPVTARAAVNQTEDGAETLDGREGAMGIPTGVDETIDADFADEMHSKIGYILPTDKYYVYDHASLYTKAGTPVEGGANVTGILYDRENAKWRYKTDGAYQDVPANAQLVLFYLPRFVCKIGGEKFYMLSMAVEYAKDHGKTARIEMLIADYSIRSGSDVVVIPEDCDITITTAETEYEGTGTAIISRSMNYTDGRLFTNRGKLTFDDIILDGKNISAGGSFVYNDTEAAELTVNGGATLRNAKSANGGAIYVNKGTVTVNGTLSGNTATNGGAMYVVDGAVTVNEGAVLSGNSATSGGAVYLHAGQVAFNGTASGNTATNGGAVYLIHGNANVESALTMGGSLTGNEAVNGGAVYQASGSLTVSGSMANNTASSNGGALYLAGGDAENEAGGRLSGNNATVNGGAVYQAGGTLTNAGTLSGNGAANGAGIYRVGGTLTLGGALTGNTATGNGGGLHSIGGTLSVNAAITGNQAANGGAVYVSGATLNLTGGSISNNTASGNGAALYALNTTTTFGGSVANNEIIAAGKVTANGNTASGNGGAVYMEGGSVTVLSASELANNKADNGGAVYATSGAINLTNGKINGNEADANGGAIYAASASVTVSGGTVSTNKAKQGNGGAVYAGSGSVTVNGGTLSGNSASRGGSEDTSLGLGGAIYAGTGTVSYSGGNINGGNTAINGAAIYVGSGIANVSASITGNTATNGGAIGVGGTGARLNFTGNANVYDNLMNDTQSNVYLDVDSELVINANSLNSGKKIGVYVPGDIDSDQVVKHGDVTGYFGAYVSAGTLANIPNVFKSDRFTDLKVGYEYNRLYWTNALTYDIYYLKNYDSQFPPTSNYSTTPNKKVCSGKTYAPRTRQSDIYDLVMAMKLYEVHDSEFKNNVGSNYASTAVYAYTFSDKALNNTFENYLKTVRWDGTARKWRYIKQDGTEAPENTTKLIIFYSAPAYLTIVNNNDSNLELDISELTVLNKNAGDGVYGFVTAQNGATVTTLRALTADDLKLHAGDSIKLMFPGAQGQKFTLKGSFTGEGAGEGTSVSYTFNDGSKQTITGTSVDFSGDSFKLNASDEAAEIIFGDAPPICKIGNEPFSTLKAAMDYAKGQKTATGNSTYKIEMLVDYLVPKDDVLNIPEGYDITFTTASRDDETLPYTGNGTRATLSRDTGNEDASVKATKSILTVDNLAFDGRSLTASGKGGAVAAEGCTTVTLKNCDFSGYRAKNGGAIYVNNTGAGSSLKVEDSNFYNCQTNASDDKAGGGGIWTTARELYVRDCTFDFCACLQGNAQAGSIFHNIRSGWTVDSKTEISGCTFSNSYSVGGSGGTIETDALNVTVENCEFHGSYTNKSQGNGGAINALAGDSGSNDGTGWAGSYNGECWLTVKNCLFDGCTAANNGNGGAIVSSMWYVTLENCKFVNNQSKYGGAVKMTNSRAKWLHIKGCTFENCTAADKGGGVYAPVPDIRIEKSNGGTFLDDTENDGATYFTDCTANRGGGIDNDKDGSTVTMENVSFIRCEAKTNSGGALYTKAHTLSITGESNTFTDCTGQNSGGAVYQVRNAEDSSVTLENCVFTGCVSNAGSGNGGGMYANARTLTITGENNGFINCTANNAGGGLYHDYAGTVTINNCGFEECTAKASYGGGLYTSAHTLTITGADSRFKNCTAQTDGGGLYHNRDAADSSFTFRDGTFENCTAVGNYGGAIYTKVKGAVTLESCTVKDSTAKAQGGGVYFLNGNTATFDDCAITGNRVTNSDSKGGGVYVPGGTTTFINSTVSGCEAASGGGWYQNNGSLYILGGSISGSAVNGGGLYMYDGNTKVYQYGGSVGGTATANGGAVYKNAGTYTLGNGTYNNVEYAAGASVGDVIILHVTENGTDTTQTVTTSAVNGGGFYQNGGTVNINEGGSVSGQASDNGGGIWNKTTVNQNGGHVTGTATNGGGVWQTDTSNGKYYVNGGTITGTASENGGAVYQSGNTFNINNGAVVGEKIGEAPISSSAKNGGAVYATSTVNLNAGGSIAGASASENGGGIYAVGNFNLNTGGSVADNKANNGGGVYYTGGTFTFKGGSIVRNTATVNGGGVYHAGGTFSMTNAGAVIGGSETNANTANVGAGVFVADGQAATFNGGTVNLTISHNHALTSGGGIAVGGPDAALTFQGTVTVRHNTMGSQNTECNVYLDQDRNTVIKNNALNAGAYIGVYASDDQDAAHGMQGKPFATYSNAGNLNVYHNDRRQYLYGMKGVSNNEVIWPEFVCKITDGEGNLLYKDANGAPAVYDILENVGATGAFNTLNVSGTPALYRLNSEEQYILYEGGEYQVQMLVQEYELNSGRQIKLDVAAARRITLTTASAVEDECGFMYTGDARFNATIKRTAASAAMVLVSGSNGWELTLEKITLDEQEIVSTQDGGAILRIENTGKVILGAGATLQNGRTNNKVGGAVYVKDSSSRLIMNAGSKIENCSAGTNNGGAVYLNNGTFTMNGGAISGCSAANGGGVYLINSSKLYMNGGSITDNNATAMGGGIALVNANAGVTFSGYCVVTGNTLNDSIRCNVQFNHDNNAHIAANGLDGRSEIGVYTADGTIYDKHGKNASPFGTRLLDDDKFYCFVNDREVILRGVKGLDTDDFIYWEGRPLIRVEKAVTSDRSVDLLEEFPFTVQLDLTDDLKARFFSYLHNYYGDMDFDRDGKASVRLKAGESATASLPFDFFELKVNYTVTEELIGSQQESYTTMSRQGGGDPVESRVVTGLLGENFNPNDPDKSTALSLATFANTRVTGELSISKQVTSILPQDLQETFGFRLTLDDNTISKDYSTVKSSSGVNAIPGVLSFVEGVAIFTLKHGETLTIEGLPTDLKYTVEELLSDTQKTGIRTMVSKDGADPVSSTTQEGTIGEKSTVETIAGVDQVVYASEVVFTNNFLEIVCKITNRSRELLYVREANGSLKEAVFAHLEDAFEQINTGNLRTRQNGTVSGTLRIEMVVSSYTMEKTATLNSGRTVVLSTALPTDEDSFPYNKGRDDGNGNICTVSRGFTGGAMIMDSGVLTVDRIVLDGASNATTPITGSASGGIVQVVGTVRLTVNSSATLQNSAVTGDGGAIYLNTGASLTMNGSILNCSAANGGGVFADTGFASITTTGTITGCEATAGSGGAIYASAGNGVNLNAGTTLTANEAERDGGAVYSEANVILRGTVGATQTGSGNVAGRNGGGVCMGGTAMFTMYAGSGVSGNRAVNGGGLATPSTARIAGGAFENNSANATFASDSVKNAIASGDSTGMGGAIYAMNGAAVTLSGSVALTENEAQLGGAVYDGGSVTMIGGSVTKNSASEKGGAVYVADNKTFTMSGGRIGGSSGNGNSSPEGAVSTGDSAVLAFSQNAIVSNNTDLAGTTGMNVYLGYDSNSVITTSGLGTSANIGVYVADGEPEDDSVPNHVDNPIYSDHGLSARNFGTYTGSNLSGARLNKFVNDRDTALTGMAGAPTASGSKENFVIWVGKGLQFKVAKIVDATTSIPVKDISFTLTNSDGVRVWSGKSAADGLVTIPWGPEEKANGNVATFAPGNTYTLRQVAADKETVLPAGVWTVTIGRDNAVTWRSVPTGSGSDDRMIDITSSGNSGAQAYLGDLFNLYNDVQPTLTYNANGKGAKLSDKLTERTVTIEFTPTETSHSYTIKETNPTWDSHVFTRWATMESKPTGTGGAELTVAELTEKGYFEYDQNDSILFFRGADDAQNTQGSSKGDMTLYAQWDEVVCKITDRSGTLLYINGSPAVYGSLEECFAAYNGANAYSFAYANGSRGTARMIEMLVPTYTLNEAVAVERGKTVMLTTAPTTDTDGYAYTGDDGTACVITRGASCDISMITNRSNLTLMDITLDGGAGAGVDPVVCDGGIVNNAQTSAVLTIASGAILRNSRVTGNGGAVNANANTRVEITGGTISGNEASCGGGIYLAQSATLKMSGKPDFANNIIVDADYPGTGASLKTNGQDKEAYKNGKVPQDIFLGGYAGVDATSIVITGALDVDEGSIWVWAEEYDHFYMLTQFAVFDSALIRNGAVNLTDAQLQKTLKAFRNARPDGLTDCGAEYLTGQTGKEVANIYWTGGFDITFKKIDGFGNALPGATFTLYTEYTSPTVNTPFQKAGTVTRATASDGTDKVAFPDPEDSAKAQAAGTVLFSKIPPRAYYMTETTTPDGYEENANVYLVLVGEAALADLSIAELADITASDIAAQTGTGANARQFAIFLIDPATGKAVARPDIAAYGIMNVSAGQRRLILRKADVTASNGKVTDVASLAGAHFMIYRADMTQVTEGQALDSNGKPVGYYESAASGVYYSGMLPFGKYYLLETKAPSDSDYADNVGKVFELTVKADASGAYGVTEALTTTVANAKTMTEAKIAEAFEKAMRDAASGGTAGGV